MGQVTMGAESVFLGIDFGTGGCKVTAVSGSGAVLGEDSVEYVTEFAHPGWSEQNPSDWYRAMCTALAHIRADGVNLSAVKALSFDGSTHNAVLLDDAMKPIRKTIMWTDQRSVKECAFLKERYKDLIFQTAYQMPAPTWTLPQLMWLRNNEPDILKQTKHILFVKDYVRYQVTGVAVTDYIEAQGTLFYDMKKQNWSEELFSLTGLPAAVLPDLIRPADIAGTVTPQASADTGIPAGTPVVCGTSDSAVEDYGAGAIEPGDCIVKLATAGNVNVMTPEAHPYATTLTYSHVIPGMWYTVSATNAAALCQRWFRDVFCDYEKEQAVKRNVKAFRLMDELAETSVPGAHGVMYHPYLQGERSPYWDPALRSSFTGVSVSSTKGDFIRALFEGVAFSLLDCAGTIQEMGLPVKRIFLIGGGARGKLWSEIVCNVFGLPAAISLPGDASFGSALLAAAGTGFFKDSAEAVRQCMKPGRRLEPDPELAAFYKRRFAVYKEIHDALAPVYAKIQSNH